MAGEEGTREPTLSELVTAWTSGTLNLPNELFDTFARDDDWTYVIKMHGIMETALNFMLVCRLGDPELAKTVAFLETSNERTGKLAFIRGYKLLSPDLCFFVKSFSELRNTFVHKVENFGKKLDDQFSNLTKEQRANWRRALASWAGDDTEAIRDTALANPRKAIWNCVMAILFASRRAEIRGEAHRHVWEAVQPAVEALIAHPPTTPKTE